VRRRAPCSSSSFCCHRLVGDARLLAPTSPLPVVGRTFACFLVAFGSAGLTAGSSGRARSTRAWLRLAGAAGALCSRTYPSSSSSGFPCTAARTPRWGPRRTSFLPCLPSDIRHSDLLAPNGSTTMATRPRFLSSANCSPVTGRRVQVGYVLLGTDALLQGRCRSAHEAIGVALLSADHRPLVRAGCRPGTPRGTRRWR